jgi:hypothetical protein
MYRKRQKKGIALYFSVKNFKLIALVDLGRFLISPLGPNFDLRG